MINKIYKLELKLTLLTGLHIGGSSENFDIGGADSSVIKNPLTKEPYIPGSSLKGKLRSLIEYKEGCLEKTERKDEYKIKLKDDTMLSVFSPLEKDDVEKINISRAIFRDMKLTDNSKELLQKHLGTNVFTEIKAENSIDRFKGKAANPRFIERVPAGAEFEGEIILTVFDGDNEDKLKQTILEALKMLEINYLGGSGTRGYGRVQVSFDEFQEVNVRENI